MNNREDIGAFSLRTIIDLVELIVILAVTYAAGYLAPKLDPAWYAGLSKPSFNPPNAVFAPVWIALYTMMGTAAFLVWRIRFRNHYVVPALIFYLFQLGLNYFWSVIFFGWHQPLYAFIEIIVLWFFILATMNLFFRVLRPAGVLLLPYFAWVTFAAVLDFYIWRLNR